MNFDKHFKETFENHEVNAPKELWDAVDSHFPDDASIFFDDCIGGGGSDARRFLVF